MPGLAPLVSEIREATLRGEWRATELTINGLSLDLGLDPVQAVLDLRLVRGGDDAGGGEHGGVGARSGQVLPRHAPVKADGDLNGLHKVCGLAREPSPP